jgi:hypothetical protein
VLEQRHHHNLDEVFYFKLQASKLYTAFFKAAAFIRAYDTVPKLSASYALTRLYYFLCRE